MILKGEQTTVIIFKCKMCGGDLSFEPGASVAECPYCGTTQTLPKLDDDRRANLYDRANHFRRQNEYDKAMAIYEQILAEDRSDAEAYWSLVLCRYGIEYVEDPATRRRVPTVNRAQYASILADEDYKSALNCADAFQRGVYEAEAGAIAEIQRGILDISKKEEPFDVFICYKETDEGGRRTPDSVLATDLYHQLTKEGFKVFFSRITLEDKIGTAYEPYIFAALNSAKVMVALGTKPEYFNAVWVKNEWSRYLALIKSGADKVLVPAYRDMDPYDLPEEFAHLQAQDMGKLGFMQDLIRGIKKLTTKEAPKPQPAAQPAASANIENLMKRARLFMEDGDWASANEYLDKVLDEDAECAPAYLGKVQAALRLNRADDLASCLTEYENIADWKKAIRFATPDQRKTYEGYLTGAMAAREEKRKSDIYEEGMGQLSAAKTPEDCDKAKAVFARIPGYRDADAQQRACDEKRDAIERQKTLAEAAKNKVLMLKEKVAKTREAYAAQAQAYRNANGALKALERDLTEAQQRCERTKNELSSAEAELQNLRGLFAGKRRRELEATISHMREGIKSDEAKLMELRKAHENASAAMPEPPSETADLLSEQEVRYQCAGFYLEAQQYDLARRELGHILDYKDAGKQYLAMLPQLRESGEKLDELSILRKLSRTNRDACMGPLSKLEREMASYAAHIAAGSENTVVLKSDGSVVAVGSDLWGQCKTGAWTDIVAVAAGDGHTVGLKSDGTVVAVGNNLRDQCRTGEWTDIVAVAAGGEHTVGLRSDGTVVAVGSDLWGQCKTGAWTDIVAVAAGHSHTVGLKSDGTVVATGRNDDGRCDTGAWTDIVAVAAGGLYTVGLKSNGTIVAVGTSGRRYTGAWTDIVAVATGGEHTVGLKSDGTVVATGDNSSGQCNLGAWNGIVAVTAGLRHTVGLKQDGTVVAAGKSFNGSCVTRSWKLWD